MILFMNADLLHVPPPNVWRRGELVSSHNRPGWWLIRVNDSNPPLYASMLPSGSFQPDSPNDGPYEQCQRKNDTSLVFQPREPTEDHVVGAVFDL